MIEMFYPDCRMDSTYEIDFEGLRKKGIKALIFDIDNTLVPHGAPADARAVELFEKLHGLGFAVTLLSNNKEPRVKMFCDAVTGASYIYKAGKPGKKGYKNAMKQMGVTTKETVFVGDQLFTDVWGAKRCGIYSILVNPIDKKEEIQIVLKRYLEKPILKAYEKQRKSKYVKLK